MVYVTESDETYNPNVGVHVLAHMYAHSTVLAARSHFKWRQGPLVYPSHATLPLKP